MNTRKQQTGFTLFVALVLLAMVTLFAVTALNLSTTNLRIAGNMQMKSEAAAAAQQAIEQVINSMAYFSTTTSQTVNVDINKDGTNDYRVVVATPNCLGQTVSPNTDPSLKIWDSVWEVSATATDISNLFGASVTVHQGIRIYTGGACPT